MTSRWSSLGDDFPRGWVRLLSRSSIQCLRCHRWYPVGMMQGSLCRECVREMEGSEHG